MAFPPVGERKKLPAKGKSKSRRYALLWCYREEPSNDLDVLYEQEVRSTTVQSAVTALLKLLNDGEEPKLSKTDLVIIEARLLGRGETLAQAVDDDGTDIEDE